MAFEYRDKDQLVEDVIEAIQSKLSFEIDTSVGEPLRTIIEAVMQETHLQYWQLEQVYNGSFIDTSYGDDLSELVKILGIERRPARYAQGEITFIRETPANFDYYIPSGTLVQTLPNQEGVSFQYETLFDTMLETGETEVTIPIRAVEGGKGSNVVANKIIIINDPPQGIESVINRNSVAGGEEEETDEELRTRAKQILDTVGLATVISLENKISEVEGVRQISVLDMERGIGTVDILVLGDVIPLPDTIKARIEQVVDETKAAGIDVQYSEPTLVPLDIEIELILRGGYLVDDVRIQVENAINNYVNNLNIGEALVKNQLERYILNSNENILDLNVIIPAGNIQPSSIEIIRVNSITLY